MKICVIGMRGFPQIQGGVEKHCEELYPRLSDNTEVIVYRRKPYVKSDGCYKQIRFIDLPSTTIKGVEAVIHSFLSTVNAIKQKPDVIHYHNIGPALFAPLASKRGIPVVLTYHSPNYEHDKWSSIAKKILLFCEKIALKYSDKIIFVNKFQMQKYSEQIQEKALFIPNGVNKAVISDNTDYLDELCLEKGKFILSVGRITPEKDFATVIRAFNSLDTEYKLVIAGGVEAEDSYMQELKGIANENVVFTGYVFGDKLYQLYTNAGLYVLASKNEGFPIVMLEAMSYGLDMLVSDIPATHLVKLDDERYFRAGDENELAEKMKERIESKNGNISYDLTEYNWEHVAQDTEKLYQSLIKEKPIK